MNQNKQQTWRDRLNQIYSRIIRRNAERKLFGEPFMGDEVLWFLAWLGSVGVLLTLLILLTGCTDTINRDALDELPTQTTQVYGLTFAISPGVHVGPEAVGPLLDADWRDWSICILRASGELPSLDFIRSWTHVVVPEQFKCKFHANYCGGEYDGNKRRIILAYDTPDAEGIGPMAYAWHEWSDIFHPETEDQNGRPCTRGL